MTTCPACEGEIDGDSVRCACGYDISDYVPSKYPKAQEQPAPWNSVTLTTAPHLEGYSVVETVEVITAECAYGMNIFKDVLTSITDFYGGRSGSIQNTLRDARIICLNELKKEAYNVGANAVIAVDLDYNEFSGQGKSMLFLVASGTAVKIQKADISKTHLCQRTS